jgi:hypothetical protein
MVAASCAGCGQGYVKTTEEFAEKVKRVANPDELQAWATNLIATTRSADGGTEAGVIRSNVPAWVGTVEEDDPGDVRIVGLTNGGGNPDACVEIIYGGGFGHYGIDIGYPTLIASSNENYYVLPWKPGIHFWDGP